MSLRPNRSGASPWSSRARRLSDSRASALIFSRTLAAPPPRCRGSSSTAHALAGPGQPRLADPGEREPPRVAEHGQVPAVAGPFTTGIGQRPADIAGHRGQQHPGGLGRTHPRPGRLPIVRRLLAAQRVAHRPQGHIVIFAPPRTRCWTPNSTSTTTSGGSPRRLTCPPSETADCGQLPAPPVGVGVGGDRGAPPHVVGRAVAVFAFGSAGAGRDLTWSQRRQRPQPADRSRNCSSDLPGRRRNWRECGAHNMDRGADDIR